jgi:hypothetical protein
MNSIFLSLLPFIQLSQRRPLMTAKELTLQIARIQQQYAQVLSFDNNQNRRARTVVVRLVNFGLGLLQLILLTTNIICQLGAPFVRMRLNLLC